MGHRHHSNIKMDMGGLSGDLMRQFTSKYDIFDDLDIGYPDAGLENPIHNEHFDGLAQYCSNSIVNAPESCAKPTILRRIQANE